MAQQSNGNNDTQEGNANVSEHHVDDEGIQEGVEGMADGFIDVQHPLSSPSHKSPSLSPSTSPVDESLICLQYIVNNCDFQNLWAQVSNGESLTICQIKEAAESVIEDINKGNVHEPPLEGDLMRQIYQSMNQPLPTITNQRQEVLYKVLDNDFLKDFCDKNTLDVTDKVVVEYVDYIRSEISFYSGLPHVSFEALQHNVWEALY